MRHGIALFCMLGILAIAGCAAPEDLSGKAHGSEQGSHGTDTLVCNAITAKCGGTRSWRNNNPGNLQASVSAEFFCGARIRTEATTAQVSHAIFETYEDGWNALICDLNAKISGISTPLRTRYGEGYERTRTLRDLVKVYIGSSSISRVNGYLAAVRQATGYGANTIIAQLNATRLAPGIQLAEGWIEGQPQRAPTPST